MSVPFCQPGQPSQFLSGFAALKAQLGDLMGDPVECEHTNPENGDTLQHTTTGLAFYRKSTSTPTFTDGWEHWAETTTGWISWAGTSVDPPGLPPAPDSTGPLTLASDMFQPGGMSSRYACENVVEPSPPLSWSGVPGNTHAFALILDAPDAPGEAVTHWIIYNLPADLHQLPENVARVERPETGGLQGRNDFGRIGYNGPCPPPGRAHQYRLTLYSLDAPVELGPGASMADLSRAMMGHVVAQAQLVGTYQRSVWPWG
jgi:Raf kinase inhibitor-like YbhB/YbcL family protein